MGYLTSFGLSFIITVLVAAICLPHLLLNHIVAGHASQCAYVVTLAGVLWGMLIYGEAHSTWVWASLVVMIIALSLVTPRGTVARS